MPPNCLNPDLSMQLQDNFKDTSINSLEEGGVLCGANVIVEIRQSTRWAEVYPWLPLVTSTQILQ